MLGGATGNSGGAFDVRSSRREASQMLRQGLEDLGGWRLQGGAVSPLLRQGVKGDVRCRPHSQLLGVHPSRPPAASFVSIAVSVN